MMAAYRTNQTTNLPKEKDMKKSTHSILVQGTFLVLTLAMLMASGLGFTTALAQSALPGDTLYSLKTGFEGTRLSLSGDAGDRSELKIQFAQERLQEMGALIDEGRLSEIGSVVLLFEADINSAIIELQSVAQSDPSRAARLAHDITEALQRFAQELSQMAATAPESVKGDVLRALETTQIASGLELPVDLSTDDGNSNESIDDNSNDAFDDNSNDLFDDHGDDLFDDNGNDALDDNSNDAMDDNSNDSFDDNSNDDSDDSNSNDDSGDNSGPGGGGDDSADDNSNDD
jgi:hypothetical protein